MCGGLGLVAVVLSGLGLGVLGPGGRRAVGGELLVADLKNQEELSSPLSLLHDRLHLEEGGALEVGEGGAHV